MDTVSPQVRSRIMSGIRSTDTKPEIMVRSGLHQRGFRYRLHDSRLPGRPDIVFPVYRAIVFVNGCFWHGHDCHLFRLPKSRKDYWETKIKGTMERDRHNNNRLLDQGWRVCRIWECALKGKTRRPAGEVIDVCAAWLKGTGSELDIRGR